MREIIVAKEFTRILLPYLHSMSSSRHLTHVVRSNYEIELRTVSCWHFDFYFLQRRWMLPRQCKEKVKLVSIYPSFMKVTVIKASYYFICVCSVTVNSKQVSTRSPSLSSGIMRISPLSWDRLTLHVTSYSISSELQPAHNVHAWNCREFMKRDHIENVGHRNFISVRKFRQSI
jgi:hypothetical protein